MVHSLWKTGSIYLGQTKRRPNSTPGYFYKRNDYICSSKDVHKNVHGGFIHKKAKNKWEITQRLLFPQLPGGGRGGPGQHRISRACEPAPHGGRCSRRPRTCVPRLAPLHLSPPPSATANANAFETTSVSFPKLLGIRGPGHSRGADTLSSPPGPAAAGLFCTPQDLVLSRASVQLNKPFLLEEHLAVKVFV